ncbi:DUF3857 domain-containing protein [Flavivirga spongiicola]|uniref:DUF3857 domain-containing protein n=1 Tax=Flavivirga spongiicola TaxID=421621 RepID=A0ABU7XVM8_9FLAO|nr:DUF3857 domain-containing protein [Flavivirga sp. MEBiC05379]MDO5979633.1 DUF3857 domain-containing protein [Flavivirga sp. MEBiC05379]
MIVRKIMSMVILLIALSVSSQENLYQSLTLPESLTKNANAVLRVDDTQINISSVKKLNHSYRRVVTVLNKKGNEYISSYVYYDDKITIKKLRAVVYDKFGKEIKKFKKNDFKDVAAVSSFSLYEDDRMKYLEYTPIDYPYTVEFEYETETSNTAWIPFWRPLEGYLISTQHSSFKIIYDASVGINKKEKNFSGYNIIDNSEAGVLAYEAKSIEALKQEEMSPKLMTFAPRLLVSTKNFHYDGYYGDNNESWGGLGKWINDKLLIGRTKISEESLEKIRNLTANVEDPIEKARIVYQFVQDNTRYISVQVGIGGIQPISALEVDKMKYGDCKGLTNYTKALLEAVGVKSNYTEVYASPNTQYNIDSEFASLMGQANHVILNIPQENKEDIWLECTSQKLPFGFIGDFTDDRDVLVITSEGGKIQHTKKYEAEESVQIIKGNYTISNDGGINAHVNVNSKGIQYDNKYWLETETERDLDKHYKERWKYINTVTINNMHITNDKEAVEFIEDVSFQASKYSKILGDRMLLTLNALNRNTDIPDRYRNRKLPLKIKRGFTDIDEVEIKLPQDYKVESKPDNKNIENKFGSYKSEVIVKDENTLIYKREFVVKDGEFPKEDYELFRNFYKEVNKQDNAKMALIKK